MMSAAPVQIPVPSGVPLFDMRIILDGTEYQLRFDWHDREKRWYLDVLDSQGLVITAGIKLVPNWTLYDRETLPNSPPGNLMSYDFEFLPPQLADFGQRSFLFYFPK